VTTAGFRIAAASANCRNPDISDFQEPGQRNVRQSAAAALKEAGLAIRFGGNDTVDLKQVDWVELTDSQDRKLRLAVDRSTHHLIRKRGHHQG